MEIGPPVEVESRVERFKRLLKVSAVPGWLSVSWKLFWTFIGWIGDLQTVRDSLPWIKKAAQMMSTPVLNNWLIVLGILWLVVLILWGGHLQRRYASWKIIAFGGMLLTLSIVALLSSQSVITSKAPNSSQPATVPTKDKRDQSQDRQKAQVIEQPKKPKKTVRPGKKKLLEAAWSAPIQYAPGGINIGRDNTGTAIVQNFTPAERHLDPSQVSALEALAASLPEDASHWFFIETVNAPESVNYAAEVETVFRRHGKTKSLVYRLAENAPIPRGVFVLVKDQNDEHFSIAQRIANNLLSTGIGKPTLRFEGPKDMVRSQVKIVVALN